MGKVQWRAVGTQGNSTAVISIPPNTSIKADGGTMIWMDGEIVLQTVNYGGNNKKQSKKKKKENGGGILNMFKRALSGESFFVNVYTNPTNIYREACFGDDFISDVKAFRIRPNDVWIFTQGAFLASTSNVEIDGKFNLKGLLPFGNSEGPFLTKITVNDTNEGICWVTSFGSFEEHNIPTGKSLLVDNEYFLGIRMPDDSAPIYDEIVRVAKGVKGFIASGEGFAMRFNGPKKVWTQSRGKMAFINTILSHNTSSSYSLSING